MNLKPLGNGVYTTLDGRYEARNWHLIDGSGENHWHVSDLSDSAAIPAGPFANLVDVRLYIEDRQRAERIFAKLTARTGELLSATLGRALNVDDIQHAIVDDPSPIWEQVVGYLATIHWQLTDPAILAECRAAVGHADYASPEELRDHVEEFVEAHPSYAWASRADWLRRPGK